MAGAVWDQGSQRLHLWPLW